MSFAGKVKEELAKQTGNRKHCQIAELAALFGSLGQVYIEPDGNYILKIVTENLTVFKKCYILFKKALHIVPDISVRGHRQYILYVLDEEDVERCLCELHISEDMPLISGSLIEKSCCKRSFLRGLFLSCGSMTDPNRSYHLELASGVKDHAERVQEVLGDCGLEAKIIERKNVYVVYMKEGSAIVDFLNITGAHVALMEFENVRIIKEMRNSINRQVNCETANIKKAVSAASRQVADIQYIHDTTGFGNLSKNLSQIARLRLENPDVTLKELGNMLEPPLGKSGVNHRLRRLSEIAAGLREKNNNL